MWGPTIQLILPQAGYVVYGAGKGLRCACGGDACAYRLVVCWDVARPLGEGQSVVRHRGLDVSVNGTAFRLVRVACETHTGV
eukprot:scaffold2290_cov105-Isochrysis_galbana.AAC.1